MEFYYQFLSSKDQKIYRIIERGLKSYRKSILLVGCFAGPYATELIKLVNYDHPELFYVDYSTLVYLQGTLGVTYHPDYTLQPSQIRNVEAVLQSQAAKILEKMHANRVESPYAKVRWIHNYLIRYIKYNYESLQLPKASAHNIQGVLQEKSAVCEGIAKTFLYLCDQEDISAALIIGSADSGEMGFDGSSMLHAWNLVKLEDVWYHIDSTFDLCQSQAVNANRYDYFCISDADMMRDHTFEKKVKCPSNEKSYFSQTGCLVKNASDVRNYVQKKLSEGKKILYFKIVANVASMDTVLNKVMAIVQKTLRSNGCQNAYRYYYNNAQGILYIKLID